MYYFENGAVFCEYYFGNLWSMFVYMCCDIMRICYLNKVNSSVNSFPILYVSDADNSFTMYHYLILKFVSYPLQKKNNNQNTKY